MNQDELKREVAAAALRHIEPLLRPDAIVGVGTGTTTNMFIDALATRRDAFAAAVSSSEASTARLKAHRIEVIDLNDTDEVAVYVDGADEVARDRALIKGGGGALAREKILAAAANRFVCIVDASKRVETLGAFPVPVEVIPMARRMLASVLLTLGDPVHRAGFTTDNGNDILDVHGLNIADPDALESTLNNMPGVVANGVFAMMTRPHTVLIGSRKGVRLLGSR